jgi:hypothetical protein
LSENEPVRTTWTFVARFFGANQDSHGSRLLLQIAKDFRQRPPAALMDSSLNLLLADLRIQAKWLEQRREHAEKAPRFIDQLNSHLRVAKRHGKSEIDNELLHVISPLRNAFGRERIGLRRSSYSTSIEHVVGQAGQCRDRVFAPTVLHNKAQGRAAHPGETDPTNDFYANGVA